VALHEDPGPASSSTSSFSSCRNVAPHPSSKRRRSRGLCSSAEEPRIRVPRSLDPVTAAALSWEGGPHRLGVRGVGEAVDDGSGSARPRQSRVEWLRSCALYPRCSLHHWGGGSGGGWCACRAGAEPEANVADPFPSLLFLPTSHHLSGGRPRDGRLELGLSGEVGLPCSFPTAAWSCPLPCDYASQASSGPVWQR
jgi:hypothetical protein